MREPVPESDPGEEPRRLAASEAPLAPRQAECELHVLERSGRLEQAEVLEDEPHRLAPEVGKLTSRTPGQVTAPDHDLSGLRALQPAEYRQQRRLARPRRSDKCQVGTLAGSQLDVVQDFERLTTAAIGV
jgi:hypothetical protein